MNQVVAINLSQVSSIIEHAVEIEMDVFYVVKDLKETPK